MFSPCGTCLLITNRTVKSKLEMKATIKLLQTYRDLGMFSVLSLNKRSEISVSGLDLFPYLRKKRKSIFLFILIFNNED